MLILIVLILLIYCLCCRSTARPDKRVLPLPPPPRVGYVGRLSPPPPAPPPPYVPRPVPRDRGHELEVDAPAFPDLGHELQASVYARLPPPAPAVPLPPPPPDELSKQAAPPRPTMAQPPLVVLGLPAPERQRALLPLLTHYNDGGVDASKSAAMAEAEQLVRCVVKCVGRHAEELRRKATLVFAQHPLLLEGAVGGESSASWSSPR